jgi:peptidoglycan/LPS O-acetylase OafA/YrhL
MAGGSMTSSGVDHIRYRRDIDGLRAVAVGAVVLTHATISPYIQGGFIGVDVFFVISGYLISSTLFKEMSRGEFSVANFYRRRILRILPALLVMLGASSIVALLYLLPGELKEFAQSQTATIAFVSNFFFWVRSGYFDAPSATKPLLHTWSLAIEEQFYIVFPLFLLAMHRFQRDRLFFWVMAIAIVSLLVSIICVAYAPTQAFYLLPSRAWELMLGAILALNRSDIQFGTALRDSLSVAGLAMIVAPIFLYDSTTPFPGLAALPACLGTALIIFTGETGTTYAGRVLSLPPFVFVGLISYSLYLWHWPILVFQRQGMPFWSFHYQKELDAALVGVAVILATISWRFVESPFRGKRLKAIPTRWIMIWTACASSVLIAVSAIFWTSGLPARFPATAIQVASYLNYDVDPYYRSDTCFIYRGGFADFDKKTCLIHSSTKPNYLLVGDSHAAQLYYGLAHVFPDVALSQATAGSCKSFGVQHPDAPDPACAQLMSYIFNEYLPKNRVDKVLIAAAWNEFDFAPLRERLLWLKSHHIEVVLFGPVPRYNVPLPRLLALAIQSNNESPVTRAVTIGVDKMDRDMKRMAAQLSVPYISLFDLLCKGSVCLHYTYDNAPLQFDGSHLTKEGSETVANLINARGYFAGPKNAE